MKTYIIREQLRELSEQAGRAWEKRRPSFFQVLGVMLIPLVAFAFLFMAASFQAAVRTNNWIVGLFLLSIFVPCGMFLLWGLKTMIFG